MTLKYYLSVVSSPCGKHGESVWKFVYYAPESSEENVEPRVPSKSCAHVQRYFLQQSKLVPDQHTGYTQRTFTGTFRGRLGSIMPKKYGGSVTPQPGCSTSTGGASILTTGTGAGAATCPLAAPVPPALHTPSGPNAGARR